MVRERFSRARFTARLRQTKWRRNTAVIVMVFVYAASLLNQLPLFSWIDLPASTLPALPLKKIRRSERVVLMTYLFGSDYVNRGYVRMFVETAKYSGVDILIVGEPAPTFPLPSNVRHVSVTWNELVDRVSNRLFDGKDLSRVRSGGMFKVVDYKPLFACLFPELVKGYDWWGHIDNDMILGNVGKFLTQEVLQSSDIITAYEHLATYGPLTLYRNANVTNELFRLAEKPLEELYATPKPLHLDEWGAGFPKMYGKLEFFNSSMSGIIQRHREGLGLRWRGYIGPLSIDVYCFGDPGCKYDVVFTKGNGRPEAVKLVIGCSGLFAPGTEIVLHHFEFGKMNGRFMDSLQDEKVDDLLTHRQFRVSYLEGFSTLSCSRRKWFGRGQCYRCSIFDWISFLTRGAGFLMDSGSRKTALKYLFSLFQ